MARYRRPLSSRWYWLALFCLLIVFRLWSEQHVEHSPAVLAEGLHQVECVVDGDTIVLESGGRVRLQGVDTPETVKEGQPTERWGPEAHDFTRAFLEDANWQVRLTFSNERIDRYGRFLAFVWHGSMLLNEELVRAGLAEAKLSYRYSGSMKTRLRKAQDEARAAQRGMWSLADSVP